ncbi:hypothetical protein EVAR_85056_1 [Eumeta japonica]|uniref:Uncharacterized protein n=1 Tax=Eumeta variegata TaxID=151549 RepID=A0A4C1XAI9_EUMVA|nr:hypothetical protein EVAR_85056_1 [Eumeta japonica]
MSSSVRSPAPNGYRAPAPSALTKLFAFCADRRPRPSRPCRSRESGHTPPQLIIIYYFRSNRWLPNGVNEAICSEPGRWPFPGNGKPDGPGTTGLGGCSSPIPAEHPIVCSHTCPSSSENSADLRRLLFAPTNNRRLIRHLRNNRQLYDQTRTVSLNLPWTKIPCSPGAGGSGPKTPITLEFIQQVLTKALSDIGYEAPQDVKSKSEGGSRPAGDGHRPSSAPTSRKRCKALPAAVQQTQTTSTASVESTRNPVSASTQAVTAKTAPRTGAKPTAPPRPKLPPPIFAQRRFLQISADCTRLRINYSKAVRTADDGIKIHCQTLRLSAVSINISWTSKSIHTYALEEERKLKAVIRGIPTDFPVDEIQADLCGQLLCTRCTDFAAETAHHYG